MMMLCSYCVGAVEDEDSVHDDDLYCSADFTHVDVNQHVQPPTILPPNQTSDKPRLRPPIPPSNLKPSFSQDDMTELMYEDPADGIMIDNNYHFLKDNGSSPNSTLQREDTADNTDRWYDDLGVNDSIVYDMNKNPPPVWRPGMDTFMRPPLLPPNRPERSSEPNGSAGSSRILSKSPNFPGGLPGERRRPLPPPKPQPEKKGLATSLRTLGGPGMQMPDLFNLKNDPKFKQKLQEKRQEVYGEGGIVLRGRSISMGEVENMAQVNYESIDDDSCGSWSRPELRVNSLHYDTADNSADNPAEYLDFEESLSLLSSGSAPELPPKTESMKRETSAWSYKPHHQAMPIPEREVRGRSSSPIRREFTPPPPLPSREIIHPLPGRSSPLCEPTVPPIHEPIAPPIREPIESPPPPNPLSPLPYEEAPPPIPVRISSNRVRSSSSNPSFTTNSMVLPPQEGLEKRNVTLARHSSSPSKSGITKQEQLPPTHLHRSHRMEAESNSFTHTLAHILSSPKPKRKDKSPLPDPPKRELAHSLHSVEFEQSADVYDDIQVGEHTGSWTESNIEVSYNDIDPAVSGMRPLPVSDYDLTSDREEFTETYDVVFNSEQQDKHFSPPLPDRKVIQPNSTSEMKSVILSLESHLQSPSLRTNKMTCPPLPPAKPKIPPDHPSNPSSFQLPPVRPKPSKPPVTEKPVVANKLGVALKSNLDKEKPVVASKPVVTNKPNLTGKQNFNHKLVGKPVKPVVTEKSNVPVKPPVANKPVQVKVPVNRTGPSPTHPKPSKPATIPSSTTSGNFRKHWQRPPVVLPPPTKPKPPQVPEKPFQAPLCS